MSNSKNNSNQTYIWIGIAVLVAVIIGVVVWFLTRKKENYIHDMEDEIEEYQDNEVLENYFIDGYVANFIENFELLEMKNSQVHPLNDHFNKILHISNVITHTPDFKEVHKEAERIGFHSKLAHRVLQNEESAHKFASKFHLELSKHHETLGRVIESVAPEVLEDVKKHTLLPKIENFSLEFYQESGKNELSKMVNRQDRIVNKLKNTLQKYNNVRDTRSLLNNEEVIRHARRANIRRPVLGQILRDNEEVKKFINNETTLENYDPDEFIENYWGFRSVFHSISHAFHQAVNWVKKTAVSVGNKIANAAKSVGHWAEGLANKIKDGVVSAYESVKHVAVAAFDKIKSGIMTAIDAVVNAAKWLAEMGKEIFEKIKAIVINAVHKFADVMKALLGKLLQPYLKIENCPAGSNPCITTVVINDKKLETLVVNKLEDLIFTEFAPELEILFKLPFVGGKIRGWITELIQPVFTELIWSHITPILGDIATGIIHAIVPEAKNIKIQFAEWFELLDAAYEQHFRDVELNRFPDKFKNHIKLCIKKCKEERPNMLRGEHIGTHKPEMLCRTRCHEEARHKFAGTHSPEHHIRNEYKPHHHNKLYEKEKIHHLLKSVVKTEFHGHLDELLHHVLQIAKAE